MFTAITTICTLFVIGGGIVWLFTVFLDRCQPDDDPYNDTYRD